MKREVCIMHNLMVIEPIIIVAEKSFNHFLSTGRSETLKFPFYTLDGNLFEELNYYFTCMMMGSFNNISFGAFSEKKLKNPRKLVENVSYTTAQVFSK